MLNILISEELARIPHNCYQEAPSLVALRDGLEHQFKACLGERNLSNFI
jgi:hypothetical protein